MRKVEIEEHQKATAFRFEKCIADRSPQPFPPSVIPPFWPSMLSVVSLFAGTYHISQHEASHVVLSFFGRTIPRWQLHVTGIYMCASSILFCGFCGNCLHGSMKSQNRHGTETTVSIVWVWTNCNLNLWPGLATCQTTSSIPLFAVCLDAWETRSPVPSPFAFV